MLNSNWNIVHLFSAPPLPPGPLKSLHISVLMGYDDRSQEPQTHQTGGTFGGKSYEGHIFTAVTDNYLSRGFKNCLINVTAQSHPCCLMGRYENSVGIAVTSRKVFSSEIGTEDPSRRTGPGEHPARTLDSLGLNLVQGLSHQPCTCLDHATAVSLPTWNFFLCSALQVLPSLKVQISLLPSRKTSLASPAHSPLSVSPCLSNSYGI